MMRLVLARIFTYAEVVDAGSVAGIIAAAIKEAAALLGASMILAIKLNFALHPLFVFLLLAVSPWPVLAQLRLAFPELGLLPRGEIRRRVTRFLEQAIRRRYLLLFLIISVAPSSGIILLLDYFMARTFPGGLLTALFVLPVWLGGPAIVLRVDPELKHLVRTLLIQAGLPLCLACGHDLRGRSEPKCPICGTQFTPAILAPKETAATTEPDETADASDL